MKSYVAGPYLFSVASLRQPDVMNRVARSVSSLWDRLPIGHIDQNVFVRSKRHTAGAEAGLGGVLTVLDAPRSTRS